jgi:hypothetical protein
MMVVISIAAVASGIYISIKSDCNDHSVYEIASKYELF